MREFVEPKGKKIMMIQHDMGRKWSVLFSAYSERLNNNAGTVQRSTRLTTRFL